MRILFSLILLMSLFSCASQKVEQIREEKYVILFQSQKGEPVWLKEKFREDEKNYYFIGIEKNEVNQFEGLREAKKILIKEIKLKLSDLLYNELNKYIKKNFTRIFNEYKNKVFIEMKTDEIIPDDTFYKKIRNINTQKIYFLCYVYKIINKKELTKTKLKVLNSLKHKYKKTDFTKIIKKLESNIK